MHSDRAHVVAARASTVSSARPASARTTPLTGSDPGIPPRAAPRGAPAPGMSELTGRYFRRIGLSQGVGSNKRKAAREALSMLAPIYRA